MISIFSLKYIFWYIAKLYLEKYVNNFFNWYDKYDLMKMILKELFWLGASEDSNTVERKWGKWGTGQPNAEHEGMPQAMNFWEFLGPPRIELTARAKGLNTETSETTGGISFIMKLCRIYLIHKI